MRSTTPSYNSSRSLPGDPSKSMGLLGEGFTIQRREGFTLAERLYFFGGRGAHRSTQAEGLPALGQSPGRRAGGKALPFRGGKALLRREGFTSAGRLYFGGEALLFRGGGGGRGAHRTQTEGLPAPRQRGSPHSVTRSLGHSVTRSLGHSVTREEEGRGGLNPTSHSRGAGGSLSLSLWASA